MKSLDPLSETLDTEIKRWLDPHDPLHAAMIALACISMRNNGGGRLILGIDDKTLESITDHRPPDLAAQFHSDILNELVGRFAYPKFEVRVALKEYQGQAHPEISISGGIDFPVITRRPYEKVCRQNAVYVRTIENGRPSTCEPRSPQDWERLIRICFDNREADIGRFFRRHLVEIASELHRFSAGDGDSTEEKNPFNELLDFLDYGHSRFVQRIGSKWQQTVTEAFGDKMGFFEVASEVHGEFQVSSMKDLLDNVFVHQPRMTGWPTWVDSRHFHDEHRPYISEGGWEALIRPNRETRTNKAVDFWRIEPKGRFYLLRTLQDDTSSSLIQNGVMPGTVFDFLLLVSRTTEAIGTIRAFAEGLGVDRSKAVVDFAFRWSGLQGRQICCWVEPGRELWTHVKAEDDSVVSTCRVPLDSPDTTLWMSVKKVVQPVFDLFGAGIPDEVLQDIVERTLNRRRQ